MAIVSLYTHYRPSKGKVLFEIWIYLFQKKSLKQLLLLIMGSTKFDLNVI